MPPPVPRPGKTRLAPSPTGSLHLGNARTFLINWALARRKGWKILLRIEDLDGPRVKAEAVGGLQRTLEWLGIDWDEGPVIQSDDLEPYREAIDRLVSGGRVFPCTLSRGDIIAAASAPQEGHELVYPAKLRPETWERTVGNGRSNWRFIVPDRQVSFIDGCAGPQSFDLSETIGDFIVWTKRGMPAYQLAVVVDDHRQGVTEIVRGDDLLESAARQLVVYRALGFSPEPAHWHLPLVVGPDGRRLAKRHGDTRVDAMREAGAKPRDVIGLLAKWCGMPASGPMSAGEFRDAFDMARLPREPIVYRGAENAKIFP